MIKTFFCFVLCSMWFMDQSGAAVKEKSIQCDDKRPRVVRVATGRVTVLNFPFKPKEVVPGSNAFDFKQIKNDLIIMAAKPAGRTNAIVYLEERRCAFDLINVKSGGDDLNPEIKGRAVWKFGPQVAEVQTYIFE